ncbi:MAG TPA: RNA 2',3'-cyclic phosphodiesterase [Chromatiales bacterium]|nr:RNA 2',3'-cyclic phosphodiesterase [Chromatiales bacterium]
MSSTAEAAEAGGGRRERLFFALWPEPAVQEALTRLGRRLVRKGGRRLPPEAVHLTLVFLGWVDPATRACLERGAGEVSVPPFELVIDRAGAFPRARVVWVGPGVTPQPLARLEAALREAAARCGLETDTRPFVPHVTLARKAAPVPGGPLPEPVRWPVADFALVRAHLRPGGAEYEVLRRWPLRA